MKIKQDTAHKNLNPLAHKRARPIIYRTVDNSRDLNPLAHKRARPRIFHTGALLLFI